MIYLRILKRFDRGHLLLTVWLIATTVFLTVLYRPLVASLFSKGFEILWGDFGTTYPLGGLLLVVVFLLLQWHEIHTVLAAEDPSLHLFIRLVGLSLSLMPLGLMAYFDSTTRVYFLPLAVTIMVVVSYGLALIVKPAVWRVLLPYALLAVATILPPIYLQALIGESFAYLATSLTRLFTAVISIPAFWSGNAVRVWTSTNEAMTIEITSGCSSISSLTLYLLLCGLMHLDLEKKFVQTLSLAVSGVLVLIVLNAVRITVLIWAGYTYGVEAMLGLHSWLGVAIFSGFYTCATLVYLRWGSVERVQASRYVTMHVGSR